LVEVAQAETFCCVQCRLLQPPTTTCAECGTPMVAPVELVRELLRYRDMKMGTGRDWAFITAMIAGASIPFPLLAPFALGGMVVLGVRKIGELRRRRAIAGVEVPAPTVAPRAQTVFGVPRKFRSTLPSLVNDAPVLAEHAVVRDKAGGVLIRTSNASPFLLERRDDSPLLVTGVVRIMSPGLFGTKPVRELIKRGDKKLSRMGVPPDLAISGELLVSSVGEGDVAVAVTGVVDHEAVAELAFHRDGGRVPVMRGTPGQPVLVEDRRLLAVALG
jgi:hypothetical protein